MLIPFEMPGSHTKSNNISKVLLCMRAQAKNPRSEPQGRISKCRPTIRWGEQAIYLSAVRLFFAI